MKCLSNMDSIIIKGQMKWVDYKVSTATSKLQAGKAYRRRCITVAIVVVHWWANTSAYFLFTFLYCLYISNVPVSFLYLIIQSQKQKRPNQTKNKIQSQL